MNGRVAYHVLRLADHRPGCLASRLPADHVTPKQPGDDPMQVSGIDHVNILTDDLETTASFYEALLGLTRSENPAIRMGMAGYWMRDAQGNPIVHLVDRLSAAGRYDEYRPGEVTNAVHHVALRCEGFEDTIARLKGMACEYRVNDLQHLGLRQIFVTDPNAVNLELNFREN